MQSIHRGVRMDISSTFEQFIKNLHVTQEEKIRKRYKRITKILNKKYYGIENDVFEGSCFTITETLMVKYLCSAN